MKPKGVCNLYTLNKHEPNKINQVCLSTASKKHGCAGNTSHPQQCAHAHTRAKPPSQVSRGPCRRLGIVQGTSGRATQNTRRNPFVGCAATGGLQQPQTLKHTKNNNEHILTHRDTWRVYTRGSSTASLTQVVLHVSTVAPRGACLHAHRRRRLYAMFLPTFSVLTTQSPSCLSRKETTSLSASDRKRFPKPAP